PVVAGADEVAAAVARAVDAAAPDKPVLASIVAAGGAPALLTGARPVASFAYPESAARALGRAAERSAWLRRPAGRVAELDVDRAAAAAVAAGDDRWLTADEMRRLFAA